MKKILFICCFFMFCEFSFTQSFQGKAIYQTKTILDIPKEITNENEKVAKGLQKRVNDELEKKIELIFDKNQSIYQEKRSLDKTGNESSGRFGFLINMLTRETDTGILYINTKEKIYKKQLELLGKKFLIQDTLTNYKWRITGEQKKIGKYTCYKAVTNIRVEDVNAFQMRFSKKNDNIEPKVKQVQVTAWYSLEIPVNLGPSNFWGLPGLIFEVSYDRTQIILTKITINPQHKQDINPPKRGKKISQTKFDKLRVKKIKEIRENISTHSRVKAKAR